MNAITVRRLWMQQQIDAVVACVQAREASRKPTRTWDLEWTLKWPGAVARDRARRATEQGKLYRYMSGGAYLYYTPERWNAIVIRLPDGRYVLPKQP